MIKLYGFQPLWGLPDISVFVMKVDAYLRMAGIPFTLEPHPFMELGNAPKGKLPFIEDGDKRVADSSFILEYLQKTYGDELDGHLSAQDRAVVHAMRRMLDENFYWVLVQIRWRLDENWAPFMTELFGDWQNDAMMSQVLPKVREAVLQEMWGHGMQRHSVDEVWHIGEADISALAGFLGDKPYFMGDRPTSLDAAAYSALAQLQAPPYGSPVKDHMQAQDNLVAYCDRMKERYYGA